MSIGDVLIVVGAVITIKFGKDLHDAKKEVKWERRRIENECKYEVAKKRDGEYAENYFGWRHSLGMCEPPRWGVPARWFEKKTYKELTDDYEKSKKK